MNYLADAVDMMGGSSADRYSWGEPIGLGTFIVAVALTLALLSWTIKNLSSIEAQQKRRK